MAKPKHSLTERELEVLQLIVDGLTDEQIAEALLFSIHSASAHRKKLLAKMNASNAAHLVAITFRKKIVK
jgi:DNA-binding CsgD family transcriptional regulator